MKVRYLVDEIWYPAELDRVSNSIHIDYWDTYPDPGSPYLVPGLVDSHCHGCEGMDVMDGRAKEIGASLRSIGVEYFCPTTITASWDEIRSAIQPCRARFPGFAGVHLEGPFINPDRGGAQPKEHACDPNPAVMEQEIGELLDLVKVVTLSPELPGASALISMLRDRGIVVSAGHTDATYDELRKSRITRMTHFYNAMRPFHHRDPGAVGYGLLEEVSLEIIYDKIHVSKEAVLLAEKFQAGGERVVAVSDGTALSGLRDGAEREMWGQMVRKENGAVRLSDWTLAGSSATLADVFGNIWQDFGPLFAVQTCSTNPRRDLGLPDPGMWLLVDQGGNIIEVLQMDLQVT